MERELALESSAPQSIRPATAATATIADRLSSAMLIPRDWTMRVMARTYRGFIWGLAGLHPAFIEWDSRARARRAFLRAARQVPAYAQFLARRSTPADPVPEMDKEEIGRAHV